MEVILLERIEKLGQMGEVVNVKTGYARNFLLPQKKALRATASNLEAFRAQRTQLEAENLERRTEAEAVSERLENFSVTIVRQASENSQLYGSVTTRDINNAVCEGGVTISRQQVRLDRPIKTVGLHEVRIALHPEVSALIAVNVARSLEEAAMQARGEEIGVDDIGGNDIDIEIGDVGDDDAEIGDVGGDEAEIGDIGGDEAGDGDEQGENADDPADQDHGGPDRESVEEQDGRP